MPQKPETDEKPPVRLTSEAHVPAPRAEVWRALNDPAVLQATLPGCTELSGTSSEGLCATIKQRVGPLSVSFTGDIWLTDVDPGKRYTINGAGKGGLAGFAKGAAQVTLEDMLMQDESGQMIQATRMIYSIEARIGGRIAQLGSRILGAFATKMGTRFFNNFKEHLAQNGIQTQQ